jgi:putative addiction module component (TIGR02574 family)
MSTYAEVLQVVLSMSPQQRRELANAIDKSLVSETTDQGSPNMSPAWRAEIARRSAEIDAGTATSYSWPETQQRARQRARRDG